MPIFSFADVSKEHRKPRSSHNFSTFSFCTILSWSHYKIHNSYISQLFLLIVCFIKGISIELCNKKVIIIETSLIDQFYWGFSIFNFRTFKKSVRSNLCMLILLCECQTIESQSPTNYDRMVTHLVGQ
jgi:hypothetical protein